MLPGVRDVGTATKRCTSCDEVKSVEDFGFRSKGRYRRSACKPCEAAKTREYKMRHPEASAARSKAWAKEHPEYFRQRAKDWNAANPGRVLARVMAQRARKAGAPVVEIFTRDEIVCRDVGRCQICGEPVNPNLHFSDHGALNLDHIIPLREGGSHTRENVRVAHMLCNQTRPRRAVA